MLATTTTTTNNNIPVFISWNYLNQVVEVVFPSDPAVVCLLTVGLVGDVFGVHAFAVEELPLEQLRVEQRHAA